jgi:hypothetical protein
MLSGPMRYADLLTCSGEDTRLVVIKGSCRERIGRMLEPALRPYTVGTLSKKYPMPSVLAGVEDMEVITATGPVSYADMNTIAEMGRRFFDDLYNCGLIPIETNPDIAWEVALAEAAEMQLYGLRLLDGEAKRFMPDIYALTSKDPSKQPAPTTDAAIYVVDSFLRASVTLLEYLHNWQKEPHEVTSNPTYEKQTQDKQARSVDNKCDKWLKLLVEYWRRWIKQQSKEQGVDITDSGIGWYLEEFVFCKSSAELSAMVADLETTNGKEPPKNLAIKSGRSVVFDSWKPYRGSGRKRTYGNATIAEALAAGLTERPEGSSYIPAKTPEQRREDVKAAKLEKQANDILKRTPKV